MLTFLFKLKFSPSETSRAVGFCQGPVGKLKKAACRRRGRPQRAARTEYKAARLRQGYRQAALGLVLFVLLASACQPKQAPPSTRVTFSDDLGRRVLVVPNPKRIVSLAPSVTEILFAIGLGDRIVGDTTYCDYPPEAKKIEKVGDTQNPSMERIVALHPDLVVVTTASQLEQFVDRLNQVGIPVYATRAANLDQLVDSINKLGEVTGAAAQAQALTASLRSRINAVRTRVAGLPAPRVLVVLNSEPLMTAGANTFVNDLIANGGGESISRDEQTEYPKFSLETAVARRPQVIFLQAGGAPLPSQLESTPAAQDKRVYHIDDNLLLKPGPRVVDALEQVAEKLHPEAFGLASSDVKPDSKSSADGKQAPTDVKGKQ